MMKMIVMNAPQSDQIGQLDEEKGVEKKIFTKSFTITIPFSKFFSVSRFQLSLRDVFHSFAREKDGSKWHLTVFLLKKIFE